MAVHKHRTTVRFGDCDPAGILYYPRYFDLFHQAMESWFDDTLDLPYHLVIGERLIGFPAVQAEASYRAPTRFGEAIEVHLRVDHLGSKSLTLLFDVVQGADSTVRASGRVVCAVLDLDPSSERFMRALVCPPDIKQRIERFMEAP